MIRAVIFDCFGVLTVDPWKEFTATLPEELKQSASNLNHSYDRGELSDTEFLNEIKNLTGRTPWLKEDLHKGGDNKNTELLEYIVGLKKNYKIGLLSNVANNWVRDYFLSENEQALFDQMVFSFEVKMLKPDPRIYQIITKKLGVSLEESIFIDDVERFCIGAKEVGMHTIHYKDFGQMKAELDEILARG